MADAIAGDAGALGGRGRCAPPSAARRSGSCCCSSPARSTPSRCTSPARRCCCSAPARRRGSALGALGRDDPAARSARRSVLEEQPLEVAHRGARAAGCRCRRAGSTSRCCPSRCGCQPGRRRARVRVEVTFGRRGRRVLAPPALVLRDPFGLAQRVVSAARTPTRCSCCRASCPVRAPAGGGEAHARARPRGADRRRRDRDRRPARAPRGLARLAHPLAEPRPRRRADGAQADLRGRLAAARRARPARAARRRTRSTPRCAPPPR